MARTFAPVAVAAWRQAARQMLATIRTSDDVADIAYAMASYDLALFEAWGLPPSDILAWAFATGQVDHEGRPV